MWQRQTEQGEVCRWLQGHAYHHRQACACRCHTAARIFSQTLARRVCQDFRAAFPCGRRPPGVAASKLVLSEAERIRRTWGWIASQRPFRTDAPLPFAIPKAPLHYALRLPPTCHDIFTHTLTSVCANFAARPVFHHGAPCVAAANGARRSLPMASTACVSPSASLRLPLPHGCQDIFTDTRSACLSGFQGSIPLRTQPRQGWQPQSLS